MKSILKGNKWTEKKKSNGKKKYTYTTFSIAVCSMCGEDKKVRIGNWNRTKEKWKCKECNNKNPVNKTHNSSKTRLYTIWQLMKRRCSDKRAEHEKLYTNIKVCDEWKNSFIIFKKWAITNGYSDNLTIDRINNNDDYKPSNCRWATLSVQMQNQGLSKVNKSGFRGVFFDKARNKWIATLEANGNVWRKRYKTKEEAIDARNKKIKEWGTEHPIQ